jgi:hypothetical protein
MATTERYVHSNTQECRRATDALGAHWRTQLRNLQRLETVADTA